MKRERKRRTLRRPADTYPHKEISVCDRLENLWYFGVPWRRELSLALEKDRTLHWINVVKFGCSESIHQKSLKIQSEAQGCPPRLRPGAALH